MNILNLFATVAVVLALLLICEVYWRKRTVHDELSRKFIHITVGVFVASWPFFLSWGQIQLLGVAFFITVAISKYFHVFQAIHSVQRPTIGELFFAAAIILLPFLTQDVYIFAAAVLHMSLADGLAAVLGTRYGQSNHYKIGNFTKSLAGTGTFVFTSLLILGFYGLLAGVTLSPLVLLAVAFSAAALENIGVYGVDNLTVPILVTLALKFL